MTEPDLTILDAAHLFAEVCDDGLTEGGALPALRRMRQADMEAELVAMTFAGMIDDHLKHGPTPKFPAERTPFLKRARRQATTPEFTDYLDRLLRAE